MDAAAVGVAGAREGVVGAHNGPARQKACRFARNKFALCGTSLLFFVTLILVCYRETTWSGTQKQAGTKAGNHKWHTQQTPAHQRIDICNTTHANSTPALPCLGFITGAGGVAPAPPLQLYVCSASPCRVRGGCRAPVSGASAAQGAVCCECGVLDRSLYSDLVGGLPFVAPVAMLACDGGMALLCVPLVISCPSSYLLMQVGTRAWVEGALRRLSIALCKGNDFLFRVNLHAFSRAAGKHPTRGATVPHTIEL